MQSLGLSNMGAYPYVRAAIIGHANKDSPGNCDQVSTIVYSLRLSQTVSRPVFDSYLSTSCTYSAPVGQTSSSTISTITMEDSFRMLFLALLMRLGLCFLD